MIKHVHETEKMHQLVNATPSQPCTNPGITDVELNPMCDYFVTCATYPGNSKGNIHAS